MNEAEVIRAAEGLALSLPRSPQPGRSGSRRSQSLGASVEVHDWRVYQVGDDVRSVDWNAVARTGELIVRLREDEVTPRLEVVLDGSASMAVTPEKATRARELALLLCELGRRRGLSPTLRLFGRGPEQAQGEGCAVLARRSVFDGKDDLGTALRRSPPLHRCGLRLVVSDFLFDAPLRDMVRRVARNASALGLFQLLAPDDVAPVGGFGARLVDAETGETLEHLLDARLLEAYRQRFEAHVGLLREAAHRARASLVSAASNAPWSALARGGLAPLVVPGGSELPWP